MANKGKHLIENDYTPVTYDPQYILMVNHLKKYFPIKGGLLSQPVGHVKAVDGVTVTPVDAVAAGTLFAMAVYIGKTRLIDNFIVGA